MCLFHGYLLVHINAICYYEIRDLAIPMLTSADQRNHTEFELKRSASHLVAHAPTTDRCHIKPKVSRRPHLACILSHASCSLTLTSSLVSFARCLSCQQPSQYHLCSTPPNHFRNSIWMYIADRPGTSKLVIS